MNIKTLLLAASAFGLTAASINSLAAGSGSCVTCGGYFYTAVSYSNPYGIPQYDYATRGPFATEEECWQVVNDDYSNNDSWLPYEGSPKCHWRFETNYEAYEDIIKDWNTGSNGNDNGNGGVIGNEEVIAKIKDLRKSYNLDGYEAELHRLIAPITDPDSDEDETDTENEEDLEELNRKN